MGAPPLGTPWPGCSRRAQAKPFLQGSAGGAPEFWAQINVIFSLDQNPTQLHSLAAAPSLSVLGQWKKLLLLLLLLLLYSFSSLCSTILPLSPSLRLCRSLAASVLRTSLEHDWTDTSPRPLHIN